MHKKMISSVQEHSAVPHTYHLHQTNKIKHLLNNQSHIFIVSLGTILGAIFTLFIGYHLKLTLLNISLLCLIPVALPYLLREVYMYTLLHMRDD